MSRDAIASLIRVRTLEDEGEILDVLFAVWGNDDAGRERLLQRLREYRRLANACDRHATAARIYRTLIAFGESLGEMLWVHLAVECRDAIEYGL